MGGKEGDGRTLYQCFFTLPSVRDGKVLAISLQLLPASRSVFNRCSSAGVHGVLVRPFFGPLDGGCGCWDCDCGCEGDGPDKPPISSSLVPPAATVAAEPRWP